MAKAKSQIKGRASHAELNKPYADAPPEKTDAIGIYSGRKSEIRRLNSLSPRRSVVEEAEHPISASAILAFMRERGDIDPDCSRKTKEGRHLVAKAPTFQVAKKLHRQHAGTGNRHGLKDRGWEESASYRADQLVALKESTRSDNPQSRSIPFQLNQLEYSYQLANGELQSNEMAGGSTPEIRRSTNSYFVMIGRNQGIRTPNGVELQLNPEEQAEANLARVVAITGTWPKSPLAHRKMLNEYNMLHATKADIQATDDGWRNRRKAMISTLSRTESISSISSSMKLDDSPDDPGAEGAPHHRYDLRSRSRSGGAER